MQYFKSFQGQICPWHTNRSLWPHALQFYIIHIFLFFCRIFGFIMIYVRRCSHSEPLLFKNHVAYHHGLRSRIDAPQRSYPSRRGILTGGQAAVKYTIPAKISIPALLSTNIHSVSSKMPHFNQRSMRISVSSACKNRGWAWKSLIHSCRQTASDPIGRT